VEVTLAEVEADELAKVEADEVAAVLLAPRERRAVAVAV
jgi:hypothetical protein